MVTYSLFFYTTEKQAMQHAITHDEYEVLRLAREIDYSQLTIENKYHILLDNFTELEEELLRFSLNWTLYTPEPWDTLRAATRIFDRRVLNFLSSARMYIDQIPGDIGGASRNPELVKEEFNKAKSKQYDESLGYRVCEALRNYTQHKNLPVHGVSHGSRREQDDNENVIINYSGLKLDIAKLEADEKFKSLTLEELKKLGGEHDLKRFLREYMHCLGVVHLELRKQLFDDGEWAINQIRQLMDKIKALPKADPDAYILLGVLSEAGQTEWKGALSTTSYTRRKQLEKNTRMPPRLMKIQLSSE